MIPFPDISPEIFSIDLFGVNFALRWYAVSYILGFMSALWLMKFFVSKKSLWRSEAPPISRDQADSFLTYLILGVIIGGRLGYVVFYNLEYYTSNPFDILKIWEGGMSFHGALAGIILGTYWFSIKKKIPTFFLLDIISFVAPMQKNFEFPDCLLFFHNYPRFS